MKNKLLKNTIIVLITSLFIRLLSLVNRIILTRTLGEEGISLYSLILPTIMLFLSISCFSLNTAMIKVTATNKSKKVIKNGITLAIISSSISSLVLLLILKMLTNTLLKQPSSYYPILFSIPLFYLTSISSVLRGFLTGIEKMSKTSIANLIEQISRILFIILIFVFIKDKNITTYVTFAIIAMSIGEFFSIIFTTITINKLNFDKTNYNKNNAISKELLEIAFPTTLTSLISNFTFFLEPIIYTFVLTKLSFSSNDILLKYSEVTAYALPLITLFSFVSISISTVIMPKISVSNNNQIKNYIKKLIIICMIPSLLLTSILFNYIDQLSLLIYNSLMGSNLIKKYVWLFSIFYLIAPFNSVFQSTNQSKTVFIISIIVHIVKLIVIVTLPFITNDALIISYLISYLLTFLIQFIVLYKKYKFNIPIRNLIILFLITICVNCLSFILNEININYIIQIIIISITYLLLTFTFIKRNNI